MSSRTTPGRGPGEERLVGEGGARSIDRKGTNGVSTRGVTAICIFFDRGTCLVLTLTYFCLVREDRAKRSEADDADIYRYYNLYSYIYIYIYIYIHSCYIYDVGL